jgi:site-specific DNA-methyltransferase (adenine-specific)
MAGSGTTAKMAKLTGRRWLGFDISGEYVELANRRIDKAEIVPEQLELI